MNRYANYLFDFYFKYLPDIAQIQEMKNVDNIYRDIGSHFDKRTFTIIEWQRLKIFLTILLRNLNLNSMLTVVELVVLKCLMFKMGVKL